MLKRGVSAAANATRATWSESGSEVRSATAGDSAAMCCARWKFDKVAVLSVPEACVVSLTDTVKPMLLNMWSEAP